MSKISLAAQLIIAFSLFSAPSETFAQGELAPGPLFDRRTEILQYLNRAEQAGVGVKPYADALAAIETEVKAGKTEAELKPKIDSLVVALANQVKNLRTLKSGPAARGVPSAPGTVTPKKASFAGAAPAFPFRGTTSLSIPYSQIAGGGGTLTADAALSGLSPQYRKYATVRGRAVPEGMLEALLFDLCNKHRRENDLPPYKPNSRLAQLARGHARDMVQKNFYAHINKERLGPFERAQAAGYNISVSENIGMVGPGRGTPIGMIIQVDDGFMKSSSHRDAILSPRFIAAGVGVCYDTRNGGIKVCQVFSPNDF